MKVEAAKNHSDERKETKNVYKTETSVFKASDPLKTANAPTTGAFAKILEETRHQKHESAPAKTGSADTDGATAKADKDEKFSRAADEKKETEERGGKHEGGDASQNGDENQSGQIALAALFGANTAAAEANAPAARSILHVADLERIVAAIRTETFQNQKQLTIALKNSVLQGLQIKLTLGENGKVKAEFLAANEQIKKQLKERRRELSEILGNRSALFAEVEIISLDSDR